jgi:hypothetical protein
MGTLNVTDINLAGRINELRGTTIASAASIDIGAATGNMIHISGTTGITSLGTAAQAGITRRVIFDGALILTHNASTLVLPGAVNLTTVAGDMAVFIADSTSKWIMAQFTRMAYAPGAGSFLARQTLISGTTYTPTSGTKTARIRMWGAGAAGGSATAVAGSANGGGGSGGYAEYWLSSISGTYTYAIGTGGAPVAGAAGSAGGDTTFADGATTITANGGLGGSAAAGTAAIKITAGGNGAAVSTNGHVNGAGNPGGNGVTSTGVTIGGPGHGGATSLGGPGKGNSYSSAAASVGGTAVANTGSGGGGGGTGTTTAALGGSGADGIIIIEEYR